MMLSYCGDNDSQVKKRYVHFGGRVTHSVFLRHLSVHGGDSEVVLSHLVGQPVHFLLGVAEDHRLGDGERVVQVAEGIELPLFLLHSNEELLDTLLSFVNFFLKGHLGIYTVGK